MDVDMANAQSAGPNILFLTVDDMSCDSIGTFGCAVPDTTPNIDRLATEGLRFTRAHVQVGNCMPSRNVMQSGLYPHNNGVEGFYQITERSYKILPELLKDAGWFVGIKGKVPHTTPAEFEWDVVLQPDTPGNLRNREWFYKQTVEGIEMARAQNKPFYLVINIVDPHTPFYGMNNRSQLIDDPLKPSKIFSPDEITVPGFLPDTPQTRLELAHYYSSVRRADDCVGEVLKALTDCEVEDNTLLMFLSDHGMPFPFAKTTVWHHGTHTPWIVRWPGVVKPGTSDDYHMISAVDFTPTILDVVGVQNPGKMDGRSFLPLLRNEKQGNRDYIVKVYNENAGGHRHPMRCIQTRDFAYIFNPWSDGTNRFRTATQGMQTYKEMIRLAEDDSKAAERLRIFDYRDYEEFYNCRADPDNLHNLINVPEYSEEIEKLRQELERWMERTGDHMLAVFRNRNNREAASSYVQAKQAESDARRRKKKTKARDNIKKLKGIIKMQVPVQARCNAPVSITINHNLPPKLKQQPLHKTAR